MASDRTWIGGWAVASVPALVLSGSNLLVLPAALIALGGVGLGLRALRRSSDAAATPLGVALLATGVVAIANVMTGDPLLAGSGIAAVALLSLSWGRLLRGRSAEHAVWAERFKQAQERDRELSRRRDARFEQAPRDG